MPQFMTRVELHNASAADYLRLHEAMATKHFARRIQDTQGNWYHLPTAEYHSFGDIDANTVLELAKAAVQSIGKTASVITSQTADVRFHGLQRV
ncbi:hypothetical protein L2Y90_12945 [Burkholderia pyrrocinia]|uniref:hypothetical protein n=1 Tax=Burkholderia pyrrocinia TaxID=60550 RepID=UPI00215A72DB|nr:hypothetical protein [Burkholderia pyrrocinia]UVE64755.1 hypothetical protein L2Y90_12945 [Burkholderia pyrrocinia]